MSGHSEGPAGCLRAAALAAEPAAVGPAAAANAASAMPPAATLLCPGAAASAAVPAAALLRLAAAATAAALLRVAAAAVAATGCAASWAAACTSLAPVPAVSLGAAPLRPLSGRFPSGALGRDAAAPCRPRRQQYLCDTVLAEALAVTGGPRGNQTRSNCRFPETQKRHPGLLRKVQAVVCKPHSVPHSRAPWRSSSAASILLARCRPPSGAGCRLAGAAHRGQQASEPRVLASCSC